MVKECSDDIFVYAHKVFAGSFIFCSLLLLLCKSFSSILIHTEYINAKLRNDGGEKLANCITVRNWSMKNEIMHGEVLNEIFVQTNQHKILIPFILVHVTKRLCFSHLDRIRILWLFSRFHLLGFSSRWHFSIRSLRFCSVCRSVFFCSLALISNFILHSTSIFVRSFFAHQADFLISVK